MVILFVDKTLHEVVLSSVTVDERGNVDGLENGKKGLLEIVPLTRWKTNSTQENASGIGMEGVGSGQGLADPTETAKFDGKYRFLRQNGNGVGSNVKIGMIIYASGKLEKRDSLKRLQVRGSFILLGIGVNDAKARENLFDGVEIITRGVLRGRNDDVIIAINTSGDGPPKEACIVKRLLEELGLFEDRTRRTEGDDEGTKKEILHHKIVDVDSERVPGGVAFRFAKKVRTNEKKRVETFVETVLAKFIMFVIIVSVNTLNK
jgi:hypothetical protein